jgi:ATP-dependent helicase YprA (DUF1998 family)
VSPSNGSLALRCGSTTSAQPTKRDLLKAHTLTDFLHLGLSMPILKALQAEGYETPTPIQAKAIPVVLAARDVLGIAQTAGKTAAFAVPIIQRLATDRRHAPRKGCRVLVLSPTRELATQIAQSFRTYGRNLDLTVAVVFGRRGASGHRSKRWPEVSMCSSPRRDAICAAAIGMARNGATFLVPRPRPDIPAAAHRERTARRARRG